MALLLLYVNNLASNTVMKAISELRKITLFGNRERSPLEEQFQSNTEHELPGGRYIQDSVETDIPTGTSSVSEWD
jgi:hypothetical protein